MSTVLIAHWYWGYINSDIAPLEGIPTPMYREQASVFTIVSTDRPLYNSAVYQTPRASVRDYAGIWFFDSEPTITVTDYHVSRFPYSKWTDGTYWCVATYIGSGDNAIIHDYTVPFYDNRTDFLDYVETPQTPPIVYNWQSVPSISGKNGILQFMSTIVDMNDGDPITTSDSTKFTLVEESNVGVITEDIDDSIKPGADAGGISGSNYRSGTQSTGYAFGQGEST